MVGMLVAAASGAHPARGRSFLNVCPPHIRRERKSAEMAHTFSQKFIATAMHIVLQPVPNEHARAPGGFGAAPPN